MGLRAFRREAPNVPSLLLGTGGLRVMMNFALTILVFAFLQVRFLA